MDQQDWRNWRKIYANWKASKKYAELKFKMDTNILPKDNIKQIIADMEVFDELDELDKEAFDLLDDATSIKDLLLSLSKTIITWQYNIFHYEKLEDYELCALMKKAILIEQKECERVIKKYFIYTDEQIGYIHSLEEEIIKSIRKNI